MKANWFNKLIQKLAASRINSWWLSKLLSRVDPLIIKMSKGKRSLTSMLAGLPTVSLKVIGAKSGVERCTILVGTFEGDKLILIASYFGSRKHPDWYYNLKANPLVRVVFKGKESEYTARETEGDERQRYWNIAVEHYPGYGNYQKWAGERDIPVLLLEPKN